MTESPPILPKVLYVGRVAPQKNWSILWHQHEHHEIIAVCGGEIHTQLETGSLRGRAGDILFYPRGVAHNEQSVGPHPLHTLFIGWQATTPDQLRAVSQPGGDAYGRIQYLARWMLELFPQGNPEHQPTLDLMFQLILNELSSHQVGPQAQLVLDIRRYVQEHITRTITLNDLAQVAGLSRYHFVRIFSRTAGCSPIRFVGQIRIESAQTLLRHSAAPMAQIARMVGLRDEYHFSRVFRRHTGCPPGNWRTMRTRSA